MFGLDPKGLEGRKKGGGKDPSQPRHSRAGKPDFEEFARLARRYHIEPTPSQTEHIRAYVSELLRWNIKVNLTAAKEPGEVLVRHVLDSLVPLAHLSGVGRLLDVGPGGGFPGIPIKILKPELFVVLVEARRKKAAFNQHVVDKLALCGIEVIWARLGDVWLTDRFSSEPFDAIISRAALPSTEILQLGSPVLRRGGMILLMKGTLGQRQREHLQEEARKQEKRVVDVVPYRLPGMDRKRNLVLIR